jgi:hypothetical protein
MKRTTKIIMLFLCASVCLGGTILSLKEKANDEPVKTKVVPINNRAKQNKIWIWS